MSALTPITADQFEMDHPSGEGRFRIAVSVPDQLPEGAADLPILFVLDGDMAFSLVAEIARSQRLVLPPCIVVGIGYGAEFAEFMKLRTGDLTPPARQRAPAELGAISDMVGTQTGGAEQFLSFIIDTLSPEIARRYPRSDARARILCGHSLGGLFAAYALLTRPESFSTFIAASPSLWWNGFATLTHLQDLPARLEALDRKPRVLVSVGSLEQDEPTEVPPGVPMELPMFQAFVVNARMVDAAQEFAEALRSAGLTKAEHVVFEGEDHGSVGPAAISRGLHLALKPGS